MGMMIVRRSGSACILVLLAALAVTTLSCAKTEESEVPAPPGPVATAPAKQDVPDEKPARPAAVDDVFAALPPGWAIADSFVVPDDQRAQIEENLGGQITRVSNTMFDVRGRQVQVNLLDCPTEADATSVRESILEIKGGDPAFCILDGLRVVEFVCDDHQLATVAAQELGWGDQMPLPTAVDDVFSELPADWAVAESFVVPEGETARIAQNLRGEITRLSNTVLDVAGQRIQINLIDCPTEDDAAIVCNSVLEAKGDDLPFCVLEGTRVIEFVCDDRDLILMVAEELSWVEPLE
jgi:hypothetical protein